MLEQQIKLLESYHRGNDVDPQALLDASKQVFQARYALRSLENSLEEAYLKNKAYSALRFAEFKDDMKGAE